MKRRFPLTREEKERKVIELFQKGTNIRDISKRAHMSFGDIGLITRKFSGDDNLERSKKYSIHSQALDLFRSGNTTLDVAIKLGLTASEAKEEYNQYMVLKGFDNFIQLYDKMKGNLEYYLSLHQQLGMAGIDVGDAIEGVKFARQLNLMKHEYNGVWIERKKIETEIYDMSNQLAACRQEKNTLSMEVETLKEVWNDISTKMQTQATQEVVPTMTRRRRFMRKHQPNLSPEYASQNAYVDRNAFEIS